MTEQAIRAFKQNIKDRNWSAVKHGIRFDTKIGELYAKGLTQLGLFFLNFGRKCLRKSLGRCSWCGANCGMSSSISRNGKRCMSLDRDCQSKPYI